MDNVWVDLPNVHFPSRGICTGGRPRPEDLRQARCGGLRSVINLCAASEASDFDEGALVTSLGMRYWGIPIGGPPDLNAANAKRLADALHQAADGPVLVHCATGNRTGALFALKAHFIDHLPADQALTEGRAAGLHSLEPHVRSVMAEH